MDTIDDFVLTPADFGWTGRDLSRPECIVERDGALWISDDRSALVRLEPDGTPRRVGAIGGLPNGFAVDDRGDFWIAEIEHGRIVRMTPDGHHEVVLDRLDGAPLGSANFVLADAGARLWISISTRTVPRRRAIDEVIADGLVLRVDAPHARPLAPVVVATGLRFTNEVRVGPGRRHLYVAETAAGAITRFVLHADGSLGAREPFGPAPLFPGAHVDGIAFDAEGNLWVTEIVRNGLWVLRPDGHARPVFEDPEGALLRVPTSVSFVGPDRRTVVVGSLRMDRLATFRSPVPGASGVG